VDTWHKAYKGQTWSNLHHQVLEEKVNFNYLSQCLWQMRPGKCDQEKQDKLSNLAFVFFSHKVSKCGKNHISLGAVVVKL
jgi:hypothetical protein